MPFLLPLLYQVGLGYTPVQSGFLIMPQALAAMSLKMTMPIVLTRFGYRRVLNYNTVIIGLILVLFATIGPGTPVWLIVLQAICFGFFSSLQYTSLNTLVYADVTESDTSMASTIASTVQQMSISFGVASASLVAALFIPDRFTSDPAQMIHGVHQAFIVLGGVTLLSTIVFRELKRSDGDNVSQHNVIVPEGPQEIAVTPAATTLPTVSGRTSDPRQFEFWVAAWVRLLRIDCLRRVLISNCVMARRPRLFAAGVLYHVIVRGNQRQKTFTSESDYQAYIERLTRYRKKYGYVLHTYCLMPNHVHLLVESSEKPLARFIGRLGSNLYL
jgi:MFS family permease